MKVMVIKLKQYKLNNILIKLDRQYLKDITNDLKKSDTWKIQLMIAIIFMTAKDNDEECVMHSKSGNVEIMIYDKEDEVIG